MGGDYIEMVLKGIPWFVAGFACCAFMSALFSRFFKKRVSAYVLSESDAKVLSEDLMRAAEECNDHGTPFIAQAIVSPIKITVMPDPCFDKLPE